MFFNLTLSGYIQTGLEINNAPGELSLSLASIGAQMAPVSTMDESI